MKGRRLIKFNHVLLTTKQTIGRYTQSVKQMNNEINELG